VVALRFAAISRERAVYAFMCCTTTLFASEPSLSVLFLPTLGLCFFAFDLLFTLY